MSNAPVISTSPRLRWARRVAAAAGLCATVAVASCGSDTANGYQVRAIFDSASFITPGLNVRVAGVTVGAVNGVELTDENQAAVTFTIAKPGFEDMREDAKCTIRPQALIGERFIECSLTEPRPEGATAPPPLPQIAQGPYKGQHLLPVENTAVPVDPDQLLNLSTATVRDRFAIIIRELGAGVAGRGDAIAKTLSKSNEALTYANRILKQLSDQEDMLKALVSTSDRTLASLASERSSLTGTVENGAIVSTRLARSKSQLQATIASLNQLLDEVDPTVTKVDELADQLQPIATDLNESSDDLAQILTDLPKLSTEGTKAVKALGPTANKAGDILTSQSNLDLFDRLVKTTAAVKASGSVLGLALGDFRSTGGLDFFLDALYGVSYSLNGRDGSGYYLRGAIQNLTYCGATAAGMSGSCTRGTSAPLPTGSKSATESRAGSTTTPKATTPSTEQASADLLLGGTQ